MLLLRHDVVPDEVDQDLHTARSPSYHTNHLLELLLALISKVSPLLEQTKPKASSEVARGQSSQILAELALFILFAHQAEVK